MFGKLNYKAVHQKSEDWVSWNLTSWYFVFAFFFLKSAGSDLDVIMRFKLYVVSF